jgi:hypothetical protein
VDLNGTDITSSYVSANNYPAQVDGGYYFYIKSEYPWSHFEAQ